MRKIKEKLLEIRKKVVTLPMDSGKNPTARAGSRNKKNKTMNINKEINKTAAILGMVPGSEKRFDFDGLKFNGRDDLDYLCYEYIIVSVVTLKEGKSGNTRCRMYGRVKYLDNANEIHREIVPWEMNAADFLSILETISK